MLTVLTGDPGDERARHGHSTVDRAVPDGRPGEFTGRYARSDPHGSGSPRPRRRPAVRPPHRRRRGRRRAGAPPSTRRAGVDVAAVRAELPGPARRRRCAGCRCRPPSPTGCGRAGDRPRSTAGSAPPTSSTAPTTSCRRPAGRRSCRSTTAGSCATPARPRPTSAGPARSCAGACRAGAVVHASSRGDRRRRPRAARRDRVEVVHLGPLAVPARRPAAAGAGRRRSTARPVRARPRHDRAAQEPPRARRARSARRAAPTAPRSSSPARPATTAGALDAAVAAPAAGGPATHRAAPGPVDDATKAWLLHHARAARLPVARRGLRLPDPRGPGGRAAGRRHPRRLDPRGRRRRRRARRPSATTTPSPALCARVLTDDERRARARRRRPREPRPVLVVGDRRGHGRPVPPGPLEDELDATADVDASICGGVGAARFLRGLQLVVPPERITAVVNTGDDTVLHGLSISPDLDTITYTLAGASTPSGAGAWPARRWQAMEALARYEPVRPAGSTAATTWFNLGDRDLATHLYRTARLAEGATPTAIADEMRRAWGLDVRLLPMTDGELATMVELATGEEVSFQDYFVRLRHGVPVRAVRFAGAAAPTASRCSTALATADVIVIAPSNPLVSIGPVRALPGVDELLAGAPRARRRRVADRRRRGPQGPGRPDARRARPRAVRRRRRPAVRARSPRRSSSTPSTPSWPRTSRRPGCAPSSCRR